MNLQGYQKISLLDFPGRVACTLFTGGCNLRCPFCHNASLVLSPTEGESMEAEALAYLAKRRGLLDGVCISGGEPLLQPDLADFIRRVRDIGLAVKLDTNGTLPDRLRPLLSAGLVDYVAMDIKSSPVGYARAVGCEIDLSLIRESIRLIRESGIPHEFRTTAVRELHTPADFIEIARIVGDDPYFIQRFVDSGNLIAGGLSAFSEEEGKDILEAVRKIAPRAALRGQD